MGEAPFLPSDVPLVNPVKAYRPALALPPTALLAEGSIEYPKGGCRVPTRLIRFADDICDDSV